MRDRSGGAEEHDRVVLGRGFGALVQSTPIEHSTVLGGYSVAERNVDGKDSELYVATDIEADGPVPGLHSMLSLASAVFRADGTVTDTFSQNLIELPEAHQHPDNMRWWSTQPEAWAACRANARDPADVMTDYRSWLGALGGRPVFVGYPVGFDFAFVSYYLFRFVGDNPFFPAALDIQSYAMALLGVPHTKATKRDMPSSWLAGTRPHSHVALDDAIGHGQVFCRMLAESRARDSEHS